MKKILLIFILIGSITAILHVLAFYHVLPPAFTYSDVALFAKPATSPGVFYFDKNIEYPVLTGLFVQFMGWLGRTPVLYTIISSIFLIGFGVATTYLLAQMLPEEKKNNLWIYWILAPSVLVFLTYNWDILVIFEVVLAIYFFRKNQPLFTSLMLALGFSTKLFPILFLPALILEQNSWRERVKITGVFLLATILINGYFVLHNFHRWTYFYRFNAVRAFNPDSIWTVLMAWFQPLFLHIQLLNIISLGVFVVLFSWLLWKYKDIGYIQLCFAITLLYALSTKVFSPQHILWLLPFFVLLGEPKKFLYYSLELSNLVIIAFILHFNFIVDPNVYQVIFALEPLTVIRFLLLVAIFYFFIRQFDIQQVNQENFVSNIQLSSKQKHLLALIIFILLTMFMTWPLLSKLTSAYPTTFYSFGGDPNMYISYMNLLAEKIQDHLPVDLNRMLYYPNGLNLSGGYEGLIIFLVGTPIVMLTHNPILAYNIILLLAFVATAYCCYYLIWYLTRNYSVALICGASFGFSTYMMVRSLQHLDLMLLFTVPLLVLTCLKFVQQPSYKNIFYLSLSVLLTAISAWYYLMGGVVFIALVFLINFRNFLSNKKLYLYAGLGIAVAILIVGLPIILNKTPQSIQNADVVVDRAGSVPWSFVLPHPFATFWAALTNGAYQNFPSVYSVPYPYFEQTSYLGVVGIMALIIFFRKKIPFPNRNLWLATFVIFLLLCMGLFIDIGKIRIPLPFMFLHQFFPFNHLRAPNRFFVFAYLAATIAFAYFLVEMQKKIQSRNFRWLLAALLILFLFSERFIFPYSVVSLPVPAFYKNLGHDQANYAIVDIPIAQVWGNSLYNYYQIFHNKPIVGGEYFWTAYTAHTYDFIESNQLLYQVLFCDLDLSRIHKSEALGQLSQNNIRYIVIHNFLMREDKDCPRMIDSLHKFFDGQKPVFADGEITVYATNP